MNPLSTYLATQQVRKPVGELAREFGCSRSHLSGILNGRNLPGRDLIGRIEQATGGAVPAGAWFKTNDVTQDTATPGIPKRAMQFLRDLSATGTGAIPARAYASLRDAGLVAAIHTETAPPGRVVARLTAEGSRMAKTALCERVS